MGLEAHGPSLLLSPSVLGWCCLSHSIPSHTVACSGRSAPSHQLQHVFTPGASPMMLGRPILCVRVCLSLEVKPRCYPLQKAVSVPAECISLSRGFLSPSKPILRIIVLSVLLGCSSPREAELCSIRVPRLLPCAQPISCANRCLLTGKLCGWVVHAERGCGQQHPLKTSCF